MKKIVFLTLVSLAFACTKTEKFTPTKEPKKKILYPRPFKFKHQLKNKDKFYIGLGEDNHEYLYNNGYHQFILIHYPDCKKCINKKIN